ncbi:MAG: hypothetical protein Q9191_000993 [Dirinaria sp. TL-2023a]
MSKKQFKSQASSSRAVSGAFMVTDGSQPTGSFGVPASLGAVSASALSYIYEPPSLSGISDPTVIVSYKNLQKKDSTTKAKALEELTTYIQSHKSEHIEEGILEAWVGLYPRTSIDNARRVRLLAHRCQGHLCVSFGKRIAKSLPALVGPWLAGLYDNDRSVSRAAQDALEEAFSSEEKIGSLWKLYQSAIIEHCHTAISKESVYTLSDERTTSPDDALAKYARVVGASILVVARILEINRQQDDAGHKKSLNSFLSQIDVWNLASHSDAFVRRAVYKLLIALLTGKEHPIDMKLLSAKVLTSSLHIDQTGSNLDYSKALALLTRHYPEVWTKYYSGSGKKSAENRLQQFLRKGSQSAPPDFWVQVGLLMQCIPEEMLQTDLSELGEQKPEIMVEEGARKESLLLDAILVGLRSKSEPRANLAQAWSTYLQVFERVQTLQTDGDVRQQYLIRYALPIVLAFAVFNQDASEWSIAAPQQFQQSICVRAFLLVWNGAQDALCKHWLSLSAKIVEHIKTSLPEQSKEYSKSQDSVADASRRWYGFEGAIMKETDSQSIKSLFQATSASELKAAIDLLATRNGKPYGAAATLTAALELTPELVYGSADLISMLYGFLQANIPTVLASPSVPYIFTILDHLHGRMDVLPIYKAGIESLKAEQNSPSKLRALTSILSSPVLDKTGNNEGLQELTAQLLQDAIKGYESNWSLVQTTMRNPATPADVVDSLLSTMLDGLAVDEQAWKCLHGLDISVKTNKGALLTFANTPKGSNLFSRLLLLAKSPDAHIASQADSLSNTIQDVLSGEKGLAQVKRSLLEVVSDGLDRPTASSLPVDTLVAQAQKLYEETDETHKEAVAASLLPRVGQWDAALLPILSQAPNPALAVTNPLCSVVGLVDSSPSASADDVGSIITWDTNGISSAIRLALYCTRLIRATDITKNWTLDEIIFLYSKLELTQTLINDHLSITKPNALWDTQRTDIETQILGLVSEVQSLCAAWDQEKAQIVIAAKQQILDGCFGSSTSSYYNARMYSAISSQLRELHGDALFNNAELVSRTRESRRIDSAIHTMAILTSAGPSKELTKYANELVADLTGLDFFKDIKRGWKYLLYFNAITDKEETIVINIPKPRLVFFVKALVKTLSDVPSVPVREEALHALIIVLPCIKDTYETFWGDILQILPTIWSSTESGSDENIPLIYMSLRLLAKLRKLVNQGSNDDLEESWRDNEGPISENLVRLMRELQGTSDENHQPRAMTNELLSRHIASSPSKSVSDASDLYPIIASESRALQQAAYSILHDHIPKEQEQKSLDKALTKDYVARLPEELLSLILAPPDEETLNESSFERTMPVSLRSYFLSWKLVFDHWTNASYSVQADYAVSLKDGSYLKSLLDFIFDVLITGRIRPVDASKYDLMDFSPEEGESPERTTHALLIHLYVLSLICLPNLSKTWWRDSTSRQTTIDVESWTEKYISPLIIGRELTAVSEWSPSQASADQPLTIKVSASTRQITASIPIDEQTMSIAIHLPQSYPLQRATVESVHRVGVDEKKWRSWLITTQGVINFSNEGNGGSLIEGLMAWRKNVTATLKGQTECSICYSVVSAEKQLPSKRCGTCRNMFHGGCLYRWFKSSNSSSCPLCRNAFHYS